MRRIEVDLALAVGSSQTTHRGSEQKQATQWQLEGGRPVMRARALRAQINSLRERGKARNLGADIVNLEAAIAGYLFAGERKERHVQLAAKRVFDFMVSGAAIVLLSPLLLIVCLLIKLTSRGPVLFRQQRTGLDGRQFEIYKFRSMYTDRCDISGVAQTAAGDPRVTPFGHFLRSSNVDELPQLFNVLKGDMSVVGPRPHVPGMLAAGMPYEELVTFYDKRHVMRPGITGLAQAHGLRGPTTDPEPAALRILRDIEYVRDFSLWLDVKIIWRTLVNELKGGQGF